MKRVVVDVDGVLLDYVGGVRTVLGLPTDWEPRQYDLTKDQVLVSRYGETGAANVLKSLPHFHRLAYKLQWLPEAREALTYFAEHKPSVQLTLATRLTERDQDWIAGRAHWFAYALEDLPVQIAMVRHKAQLVGDYLVEDNADEANEWAATGRDAYLVDASYNRHEQLHARVTRVENLCEALYLICKR